MENERCRFQGIALSPETGIPLSCRVYTAASLLPGMIFVRSFNRRRRSVWRLGFAVSCTKMKYSAGITYSVQERSNRKSADDTHAAAGTEFRTEPGSQRHRQHAGD